MRTEQHLQVHAHLLVLLRLHFLYCGFAAAPTIATALAGSGSGCPDQSEPLTIQRVRAALEPMLETVRIGGPDVSV
jgi:hypothetical protein